MKCEKCGEDFPSRFYFRTESVCSSCFERLDPAGRKEALMADAKVHCLTTTAFSIDGYSVVRSLGIVRGIVVRSRSIFGTLGASLQTLVGGNITLFTELCEKTRADAFNMMVSHAEQAGGNGVIGVRYDATELMSGVSEVLCYGTAVIIQPE
jgi:uncharacterized protein YbjQ (UPF0145 family)